MDVPPNEKCGGICFHQEEVFVDGEWKNVYVKDPNSTCDQNCQLVKCVNYEYCKEEFPQNLLDCYAGRCMRCDFQLFTGLPQPLIWIKNEIPNGETELLDCCICLEKPERFLKLPSCSHMMCATCLRKFNIPPQFPDYPFPFEEQIKYDDFCDLQHNDPKSVEWITSSEAFKKYEYYSKLNDDINGDLARHHEANRKCPLCRSFFKPQD